MDLLDALKTRGFVQQCTHEDELTHALQSGRVTCYVGFDPTADSLHAGSLLQLMLAGWFQRAGHQVVALMGSGTARVGDPSGKTELRAMLSDEQIARHAAGIRAQVERLLALDGDGGIYVDNATWLLDLKLIPFLRDIGSRFSVNRMLAAEAYKSRLERGLSFIEFNYQVLQAYDFLELHNRHGVALQLGGDDQWGNIVAGVDLVRRVTSRQVWGLTTPLLTTAAGAKMGKTAQGAVWLDAKRLQPFDYWQYWYGCDDRDVGRFLRLYTFLEMDEIERLDRLRGAELRDAKRVLANEATAIVHGREASQKAERAAAAMTGEAAANDLPTIALKGPIRLIEALRDAGLAASLGAARRLIQQGGVRVDGDPVSDVEVELNPGDEGVVVRVGKKRSARFLAQR